MIKKLRLALAQYNFTVGDFEGNKGKILKAIDKAQQEEADIVVFPELAVTGYPPEDLLLKPQFIERNLETIQDIAKSVGNIVAIIGFVDLNDDIYNAAAIIYQHKILDVYHKIFLPTYSVYDEDRYFGRGKRIPVYEIKGSHVGVNICEDIWYPDGPGHLQALAGAEVIINISASPYYAGKREYREKMISVRAMDHVAYVAYVNLVGGQDELVFDGGSFVADPQGKVIARAKCFEDDLLLVDIDTTSVLRTRLHDPRIRKEANLAEGKVEKIFVAPYEKNHKKPISQRIEKPPVEEAEIFEALVLGTRDYVEKNGFKKVLIGLSGGIDSSLVAAIATEALGPNRVVGVLMPSQYTSKESIEDAQQLAGNLCIKTFTVSIKDIFEVFKRELKQNVWGELPEDVTEENLQARIRGTILMSISNKFGWLVLTTGNKSEMSCGYATLYGDMAGGFAVIKDVMKTMVYRLAQYYNQTKGYDVIPKRVLVKPPSAELKPNQTDQDTLPPYEILDPILKAYVEEDRSYREIVAMGFDKAIVRKVIQMVDKNEYKRRQAPPGIKITPRAFGKDRRLPITNKFRPFESSS
ncbi:NAD+ synthase (glutamine-hydrolysing) [Thermosulfidibacter takaii ABI70S6]|uniref:Glutamine-dependent NAD(+) synthetase n=1 Tax=Thermosulfidibacter takaii (strain DSM 17441 / JCM 13301 / NBRC 103674 / ABI70S6) TaxID=1298851 RepID=A0A0S3QUX9_THET7|nr:NAD+ synthase [Thermosulfidibacter takaii]BAT72132.1 NAD+ synthase (glutamine-hydrolysing) [Thermosulfidibacter takaii ABI70S6]